MIDATLLPGLLTLLTVARSGSVGAAARLHHRTSSAISAGSQIGGIASGTKRPGCLPHHSSMCQSLYARHSASAASLSSSAANRRPANPGSDGKFIEPSRPFADMSSTRWRTS
jgi:hypothetical protein